MSVQLADFNDDGLDDIVGQYEHAGRTGLSVLLGRAGGGFVAEHEIALHDSRLRFLSGPFSILDANNDGALDIILPDSGNVAGDNSGFEYYVVRGDGTGRFTEEHVVDSGVPVPLAVGAAASADINGDMAPDVLLGGVRSSELYYNGIYSGHGVFAVLQGEGGLRFRDANDTPLLPNFVNSIVCADFTGDGLLDALLCTRWLSGDGYALSERPGGVSILPGLGDGSFESEIDLGSAVDRVDGTVRSAAAADMNRDGVLDIVVATEGGVSVLLGSHVVTTSI